MVCQNGRENTAVWVTFQKRQVPRQFGNSQCQVNRLGSSELREKDNFIFNQNRGRTVDQTQNFESRAQSLPNCLDTLTGRQAPIPFEEQVNQREVFSLSYFDTAFHRKIFSMRCQKVGRSSQTLTKTFRNFYIVKWKVPCLSYFNPIPNATPNDPNMAQTSIENFSNKQWVWDSGLWVRN